MCCFRSSIRTSRTAAACRRKVSTAATSRCRICSTITKRRSPSPTCARRSSATSTCSRTSSPSPKNTGSGSSASCSRTTCGRRWCRTGRRFTKSITMAGAPTAIPAGPATITHTTRTSGSAWWRTMPVRMRSAESCGVRSDRAASSMRWGFRKVRIRIPVGRPASASSARKGAVPVGSTWSGPAPVSAPSRSSSSPAARVSGRATVISRRSGGSCLIIRRCSRGRISG